jgi:hypothetical protein
MHTVIGTGQCHYFNAAFVKANLDEEQIFYVAIT